MNKYQKYIKENPEKMEAESNRIKNYLNDKYKKILSKSVVEKPDNGKKISNICINVIKTFFSSWLLQDIIKIVLANVANKIVFFIFDFFR